MPDPSRGVSHNPVSVRYWTHCRSLFGCSRVLSPRCPARVSRAPDPSRLRGWLLLQRRRCWDRLLLGGRSVHHKTNGSMRAKFLPPTRILYQWQLRDARRLAILILLSLCRPPSCDCCVFSSFAGCCRAVGAGLCLGVLSYKASCMDGRVYSYPNGSTDSIALLEMLRKRTLPILPWNYKKCLLKTVLC